MASVSVDPVSNQFHIRFRFAGQAFKRSLKTESPKEATAALARVEETLSLLQRGVLELPADADPATFGAFGGSFGKDKNTVYHEHDKILGADPATFEVYSVCE